MIDVLLSLVGIACFAWLVIVIHEYGHFIVGRVVGIPRGDIRVDLSGKPPHNALRRGSAWLSPDDAGYIDAFRRHAESTAAAWAFVSGGVVVETALSVPAIVVIAYLGGTGPALLWAWTTLVIFIIYVVGDAVISLRTQQRSGDFSSLWEIHRPGTVLVVLVIAVIKVVSVVALH